MSKLKIAILVSGRGSNMEAILKAIKGGLNAEAVLVISDKAYAPALEIAASHKVPTLFLDPKSYPSKEEYDQAMVDHLNQAKTGLVCMAGYMRIVTPVLLKAFPAKVMNIHPALLPSFKGLRGQKQALDYGAKISGCTVHFVTEEPDGGPIIVQAAVDVEEDDTVESLSARILAQEHLIFPRAIGLFAAGKLETHGRRVVILE